MRYLGGIVLQINSTEVEQLMSDMDLGLICIDDQFKIKMFNEKAKEIVGINITNTGSHHKGRIEDGDIVIIADNSLGADDGNLTYLDLERININDSDIHKGDTLLAIGVYNDNKTKAVYKFIRGDQLKDAFSIQTNYLRNLIKASIDRRTKTIIIQVNEKNYPLKYFHSVGHMVIIDGSTNEIKFFQEKGYSIRKEEVGSLLRGGSFLGKSMVADNISIRNVDFMEIFEDSDLTEKIHAYFKGEEVSLKSGLNYLNKRLAYCSFYTYSNDQKNKKLYLVIRDGSELEDYLMDRNTILEQVEKKHRFGQNLTQEYPANSFKQFAGNSPEASEVKYLAYKASKAKFNVIITGESGTGKSLLAKEIHNNSGGLSGPFIEVNCNAITPTLFESELFGYVGGAFTGATSSGSIGYFEEANGGTIFLDEIGDIPLEIQVKLLHVLENKMIYKVGSSKPIAIDVRVIAATNRNLEIEVEKKRFRQDLYYRINVFPIEIPPIKERKSDLYLLINQLLKKICNRYDLKLKQLSGEALNKIIQYDWPGNVRELENILERAITLCSTNIIYPEHIKIKDSNKEYTLKSMLEIEEKNIIKLCLEKNKGDKVKTIEDLNISRTTFYEKLNKYNIK